MPADAPRAPLVPSGAQHRRPGRLAGGGSRLVGFGGNQPRALIRDWLLTAKTGSYAGIVGGAALESKLREFRLPVLALRIDGDSYAAASAVEYLLRKCPRARVTRALASSERLAAKKPDRRHVAWAREPEAVLPHLRRWMAEVTLLAANHSP